jgi:hypothetical protein
MVMMVAVVARKNHDEVDLKTVSISASIDFHALRVLQINNSTLR